MSEEFWKTVSVHGLSLCLKNCRNNQKISRKIVGGRESSANEACVGKVDTYSKTIFAQKSVQGGEKENLADVVWEGADALVPLSSGGARPFYDFAGPKL